MATPDGCPLDIDPVEIGKLTAQVEFLAVQIAESNLRLRSLENQIERGRGMGLGILLATVGLSAGGASILTKWLGS